MNLMAVNAPAAASTRPASATHPRAGDRWIGATLIALGACVAALSVLGPLVAGVIEYRVSDEVVVSQLLGLDAVALAVVAPLANVAGVMALRGHRAWPVVGIGPALFVLYMVPQYVFGPDYIGREGNNERFFPLFLALFIVALVAAIAAWSAMDLDRVSVSMRAERLVARIFLPVAAFLAFGRYLSLLSDTMSASPAGHEYLAGPVFVWTITLLDLGLALPATVAACVGFRRGARWARNALYAVVAWFALVGVAVGAMAVAMSIRNDPGTSVASAATMVTLGLAFAAMAAALWAPLVRR
jgi:hypothetical protein